MRPTPARMMMVDVHGLHLRQVVRGQLRLLHSGRARKGEVVERSWLRRVRGLQARAAVDRPERNHGDEGRREQHEAAKASLVHPQLRRRRCRKLEDWRAEVIVREVEPPPATK